MPTTTATRAATFPEFAAWERDLRRIGRSPLTIESYDKVARAFYAFLDDHGMPTDPLNIRREHIESYFEDMRERRHRGRSLASATIHRHHRNLRAFFNWLADRDYIQRSPMTKMRAPALAIRKVRVPDEEELVRLFATCDGRSFTDRRDSAILHMFMATGLRLSELTSLQVEDLDLEHRLTTIIGKGDKERTVRWSDDAATALDRYLLLRARHRDARDSALWLGVKGPLKPRGIAQVVKRRAKDAGIDMHSHTMRHLFASHWLANGGQENELLELGGWTTVAMIHQRYGRGTVAARSLQHYDDYAPRLPRRR
jgi:site-specific recombinase XerD